MDQETGEELLLDGNPVTAETAFTPEERSGSVEVVFTLDGSSLAGKSLVVFETLYYVDADGTQRRSALTRILMMRDRPCIFPKTSGSTGRTDGNTFRF